MEIPTTQEHPSSQQAFYACILVEDTDTVAEARGRGVRMWEPTEAQGLRPKAHSSMASYHWVRLGRWRLTYMWQ